MVNFYAKRMTFSKEAIIHAMKETGVVPLFTHDDPDDAQQVIETSYRAGLKIFEFTNRRKNSFEVFKHLLTVAQKMPGMMLGIGTVMDGPTAKKFIDVGAHFVISPVLQLDMAEVCKKHDRLWIPGCATLTEIVTARRNGAELIKIFPGAVLGPKFISSILPVVPDLQLMITGGVEPTESNLSSWFSAGATCVGMGSHLFTKDIISRRDWQQLEKRIADVLQMVQTVRS